MRKQNMTAPRGLLAAFAAILALSGCDQRDAAEDGGALDGGVADAGAMDGGAVDGGAMDAGDADGGAMDGGAADGGAADGGDADGGDADGGAMDGGDADGGATDGGMTDGGADDGGGGDGGALTSADVLGVATQRGGLTQFLAAVARVGLDTTLSGEGPFTVLIPSDVAFSRMPAAWSNIDDATLRNILRYHVLAGVWSPSQLVAAASVETSLEATLSIDLTGVGVILQGLVRLDTVNLSARNGVIHIIDGVLWPPGVTFPGTGVDFVRAYYRLAPLQSGLERAGLVTALGGAGPFTLFAPTNEAFFQAGINVAMTPVEDLSRVLRYHVAPGALSSTDLSGRAVTATLLGPNVSIEAGDGIRLNGSVDVLYADFRVTNGVVHVVNGVLVPPAP